MDHRLFIGPLLGYQMKFDISTTFLSVLLSVAPIGDRDAHVYGGHVVSGVRVVFALQQGGVVEAPDACSSVGRLELCLWLQTRRWPSGAWRAPSSSPSNADARGGAQAEAKRLECASCGRRFSSAWGLKVHEDGHRGIFPYHCAYCARGFTSQTNLRGHLVKHTGVREFRCTACGREYTYARELRRHAAVCAVGGRAVQDGTGEGTGETAPPA